MYSVPSYSVVHTTLNILDPFTPRGDEHVTSPYPLIIQ